MMGIGYQHPEWKHALWQDELASGYDNWTLAGYDPKAAPIYANALIGMVTFVGKWWTEERKPDVQEVAKHIGALAWMGPRHLPKRPTLAVRPG